MVSAAIRPVVVILAALTGDKLKSWIAIATSFVIQNVTQCGVGSLRVSDALDTR
jgi:L-lactate permease